MGASRGKVSPKRNMLSDAFIDWLIFHRFSPHKSSITTEFTYKFVIELLSINKYLAIIFYHAL